MLPRLCVQVSQRDAERLRDVLNAVLPPERKLHLLSIAGDVEPELSGPFADDQDRLEAAQDYRRAHGDEDGLFRVNATGDVTVGTFSGGELEMPNPPRVQVHTGDRVRDPLDAGRWRTVERIEGDTAYMTDGGCMGIAECRDILLPGELPS